MWGKLELAHGFDERYGFDVADGSSELDDAYVWDFACFIYGDFADAFDAILDRICDVWDDLGMCFIRGRGGMKRRWYLHCLAQIFSFSLLDIKISREFMDDRKEHGCGLGTRHGALMITS